MTIHADGAEDALHRLSPLALRGPRGVSFNDVKEECHRSIDAVVHVAKIDGVRAVRELLRIRAS